MPSDRPRRGSTKWLVQGNEANRRHLEANAIAEGCRFRVPWTYGRQEHPANFYFAVLAEAESHRDEQVTAKRFVFTPTLRDSWYPEHAVETYLRLRVEQYVDGAWQAVAGSDRECLAAVRERKL
jgi:hypothetical protein